MEIASTESDISPRVVGIDYGEKRVGLAMADPLRLFAQPVGTFSPAEALNKLKSLDREEGVSAIAIGWPLTLDGREGEATERVQKFIDRLEKALPAAVVEKVDERYSSRQASQALIQAGVRKKSRRQKGRVDAAAAALILQEYLDERAAR